MFAATANFTKKHWAILGKAFLKNHPEQARAIISQYLPDVAPIETDHSKISEYFSRFCRNEKINPEEFKGPLYKTSKIDVRKKFIAVIVHLYCPQAFIQSNDFILSRGLVKNLADALGHTVNGISMNVKEVILWERQYEDFKNQVSEAIKALKKE